MNLIKNKIKMISVLFYLSAFIFSCNAGEKEVIIIPKDFKGYIVIIYNQKNGIQSQFITGKRIYKIPPGGIYKTQLASNEGLRDIPEFYYEEMTKEKQFPSYVEFDKIPPNVVVGFIGTRGSANKDYEGKETIEYSLYYIGTKEEIRKAITEAESLDVIKIAD